MPTKETKKSEPKEESSRSSKPKSESKGSSRSTKKLTTKQLVEAMESLSVIELVELKNELAERWNVSLTAPMMAAQPAAAQAPAEEEVTEFDVILSSVGEKKIPVIKVVREVTSLGLKEAKEVVESAPSPVRERANKEAAQEIKAKLEEAGATVEIKPSL
ncbi:50S ribosomal protein L7/L12 [bacterium]|nr:50S ribosomal protein L7/L12 [bacterium]